VVWRQTTDTFMQCLENAFHYFGSVSKRLVIDNLKAAVPLIGTTPSCILDLIRRLINSLIFRTENGIATTRKFEVRVWDGDGAASNTLLRTINTD
jgi:hypothetical protein